MVDKWFPNILGSEGELDTQEVLSSTRLSWESIYSLKHDVDGLIDTVGEILGVKGEGLESPASQKLFGRISTGSLVRKRNLFGGLDVDIIEGGRDEGRSVLNPDRNRIPYLNRALQLDTLNAPEYDPATKALTITGAITGRSTLAITGNTTLSGTLAVTGAVTLSSTLGVTGATTLDGIQIIDVTNAEALLVRANSDGGDVFSVNTTTPGVIVTGTLNVTGTTTTVGRIKTPTRATTTYIILVTDSVVFGNTDGSAWTATLPAGVSGQTFKIINSGSSGNNLTVAPNGSEHLLGVNSNFLLFDAETLDLTFDSTDGWY